MALILLALLATQAMADVAWQTTPEGSWTINPTQSRAVVWPGDAVKADLNGTLTLGRGVTVPHSSSLSFTGKKYTVDVSLDTGEVTAKGVPLPESGKVFWEAVSKSYFLNCSKPPLYTKYDKRPFSPILSISDSGVVVACDGEDCVTYKDPVLMRAIKMAAKSGTITGSPTWKKKK